MTAFLPPHSTLRVAYMTGQYPRATDTFIQREVAALRELGHYVETFSVRRPSRGDRKRGDNGDDKDTIYLLPPRGLLSAHIAQFSRAPRRYMTALALALRTRPPGAKAAMRQLAYFAEAALLARIMKRQTLLHIHNHLSDSSCSVAALAAEMAGVTFSFTVHGSAELVNPDYWWLGEKVRRSLFVICISHFCRSQVMLASAPDLWTKLQIVHCGVNPSGFAMKSHQGIGSRVLFVGRLAAAKGLPILLAALAKLPGVCLDVAGDGPLRAFLETRTAELGIENQVNFLGMQSQSQVQTLMAQADVFVMTSFAEGLPVVLMEAMASGLPVVAPVIAGIPELVEHERNGLLVPPGDVEAIVAAVRRLLDDPSLRNKFAIEGRRKVELDFNIQIEARRLANIMTTLADRQLKEPVAKLDA